ncbi:hypothetical protein BFJ70_g5104 [Fusarium oxysporum]|uniref:Zn(2)-C6 fungal-type domain-containing protein n=1 Tax=Fusarium oxysporum f. sp. cepae TaxID=396571 RepID=A0A3L6N5H4_FUSOX|nr:hypothetical protein FOWG_14510 [Fusarium oxysporum f. sp. lycopersici MN25]KAJ4128449.1 hypothetical protein NW765_012833 [Fusarium oxysporum]RKK11761.1 hypothetical protein BFJ65_g13636 [Fusarium oxysporum f. sp. cepae]KAJ4279564.1 hypothetical protein NW764_006941 [Fusarium oxysporum]RKK55520.1 hypothetical protein BFJ67_g4301 [Fusarium oxysporum f. sp. cepae]
MVNYGVSRACETCKKRRKKCDETRPACLRCVKSRRRCPGYKDNTSLLFRHYQPSTPPLERWHPSNDFILEATALDIFLDNLVVQSRDRSHSRGFLDGMHYLFATSAPMSTLMRAARIVVLSSLANRYRRDSLMSLVRRQYGQVLVDYTTDLSQQTASPSVEHFFTAVLLGLYELVASDNASPTKHLIHVRGLASILSEGITCSAPESKVSVYSPGMRLVTKGIMTHQTGTGILCPPLDDTYRRSLDDIIIKMSPLTSRAEKLLADPFPPVLELLELQQDLLAIDDEITYWAYDRPPSWNPEVVGEVWIGPATSEEATFYCAGPVEKYFDIYVATAWNSWRSIHALYLDHLVHIANTLGQYELVPLYKERIDDLAAGIKASIPFHLSHDVETYIQQANAGTPLVQSDRLVGGLLLLHPMYALARCTIVDDTTRKYMSKTLRWIGDEMGIRHATILADGLQPDMQGPSAMQSSKMTFIDALDGHFLITASMMLEPQQVPSAV